MASLVVKVPVVASRGVRNGGRRRRLVGDGRRRWGMNGDTTINHNNDDTAISCKTKNDNGNDMLDLG
jgi:hypothetical protein